MIKKNKIEKNMGVVLVFVRLDVVVLDVVVLDAVALDVVVLDVVVLDVVVLDVVVLVVCCLGCLLPWLLVVLSVLSLSSAISIVCGRHSISSIPSVSLFGMHASTMLKIH